MANVYEGDPDARQSDSAALIAQIKTTPTKLYPDIISQVTANQAGNIVLSLRHLEDAVYRAVKALTG